MFFLPNSQGLFKDAPLLTAASKLAETEIRRILRRVTAPANRKEAKVRLPPLGRPCVPACAGLGCLSLLGWLPVRGAPAFESKSWPLLAGRLRTAQRCGGSAQLAH